MAVSIRIIKYIAGLAKRILIKLIADDRYSGPVSYVPVISLSGISS